MAENRAQQKAAQHYQDRVENARQTADDLLSGELETPEQWAAAADALVVYANILQEMDYPGHTEQALEAYQDALRLLEALPMENLEYRHTLARTLNNVGNILRHQNRVEQGIELLNKSLELSAGLPMDNLFFAETRASTFGNRAMMRIERGSHEDANEASEAGVNVLRELELGGIYERRDLRERLFDVAAFTYLHSAPTYLPEFIQEHLSPAQPGSAPNSIPMHSSAQRFLHAMHAHAKGSGQTEWLKILPSALYDLTHIRNAYLNAESDGARLTAEGHEKIERDLEGAEQCLVGFCQDYPHDMKGWQQLAAFYRRTYAIEKALPAYQHLAELLLQQNAWEQRDHTLEVLLRISLLTAYGSLPGYQIISVQSTLDQQQARMQDCLQQLQTLLGEHWPDYQDYALAIQEELQHQTSNWLNLRQQQRGNDALREYCHKAETQWHEAMQEQEAKLRQMLSTLPLTWEMLQEKLHGSVQVFWRQNQAIWEQQNPEQQRRIIQQLNDQSLRLVQRYVMQLDWSRPQVQAAQQSCASKMGMDNWQRLSREEQASLQLAELLLSHDDNEFAALAIYQLLEQSLLLRLFVPVREALRSTGIIPGETALNQFLNRQRPSLQLSYMLSLLGQLMLRQNSAPDNSLAPALQLIRTHFEHLPASAPLLALTDAQCQAYWEQLQSIQNLRQAFQSRAHPIDKAMVKGIQAQLFDGEGFFLSFIAAWFPTAA